MSTKPFSRRAFLRSAALCVMGALAGCQPKVVEKIVKETVEVQKQVEKVVKETVVVQQKQEVTKVVEKIVTQAPSAPKAVDLRLATLPFFVPRTEEMVFLFQAAHPEAKVAIESIEGDFTQKMMTLVAGGTLQDIVWTGNGYIEQLVLNKVCPDMNPYAQLEKPNPMDDVWEAMQGVSFYNGGLYMIPWALDIVIMYYNKKILAEAGVPEPNPKGQTMEEYIAMCKACTKATKKGGEIDQWGTNLPVKWNAIFTSWIYGYGGRFFNEDKTKVELNSPGCVEAFTVMTDFWTKYKVAVPWGANLGGDPFTTGKCATSHTIRMLSKDYRTLGMDFDVCAPPAQRVLRKTGMGTMGFAITTAAQKRGVDKSAWQCCATAVSPLCQKTWARDYLIVPVIKSLKDDPIWRGLAAPPKNTDVFIDALQYAITIPDSKGLECGSTYIGVTYTAIMDAFDNIVIKGMPVQQAMDAATKEINDCLAKNTKK